MLLELNGGGIKNIYTDTNEFPGCETCDWGSQYINEYTIEMFSGNLTIKAEQMYEYPLSEGYMMETLLPNLEIIKKMTEDEFSKWIEDKINQDINKDNYSNRLVVVNFKKNL